MKRFFALLIILCALLLAAPRTAGAQMPTPPPPEVLQGYVYEMIDLVNQLRAANGLPALTPNPILMQVVQAHADYQASVQSITHWSWDGTRPFQRALNAGYWVAGDLSRNGWYSENIMGGPGLTPQDAVLAWQGDAPHLNTMLGPYYEDIGSGVATDGEMIYFTINTAKPSGVPVAYTPVPTEEDEMAYYPVLPPVAVAEAAEDGSITHIVQSGDTLWTIAAAYGLTMEELTGLNDLSVNSWVYPGDELEIRLASTPTPERPTQVQPRTRTPEGGHSAEFDEGMVREAGEGAVSGVVMVVVLVTLGILVGVLVFGGRGSSGNK